MLFSSDACHRLEPVSEVGSTMFERPFFHCDCNRVRDIQLQMGTAVDRFCKGFVDILRETCFHFGVVEYKTAIQFRNTFAHRYFSFQLRWGTSLLPVCGKLYKVCCLLRGMEQTVIISRIPNGGLWGRSVKCEKGAGVYVSCTQAPLLLWWYNILIFRDLSTHFFKNFSDHRQRSYY